MQSQLAERMDSMEMFYKKAAEAGAETRLDYNKTVLERMAAHRELNTLKASRAALLASLQTPQRRQGCDGYGSASRLGLSDYAGSRHPLGRKPSRNATRRLRRLRHRLMQPNRW